MQINRERISRMDRGKWKRVDWVTRMKDKLIMHWTKG